MTESVIRARRREARPLELETPEATILVSRTAYGNEAQEKETIRVPAFHTTPARVRVVGSVTRNLGDYNSARVEVMVEIPCYPEATDIDRAYAYASSLIDRYIPQELDKALGTEVTT